MFREISALVLACIFALPLFLVAAFHLLRCIGVVLNIFWFSVVKGGDVAGYWQEVTWRSLLAGLLICVAVLVSGPFFSLFGWSILTPMF